MSFCASCGAKQRDEAGAFCEDCGATLSDEATTPVVGSVPVTSYGGQQARAGSGALAQNWPVFAGIGLVLLIVGGVWAVQRSDGGATTSQVTAQPSPVTRNSTPRPQATSQPTLNSVSRTAPEVLAAVKATNPKWCQPFSALLSHDPSQLHEVAQTLGPKRQPDGNWLVGCYTYFDTPGATDGTRGLVGYSCMKVYANTLETMPVNSSSDQPEIRISTALNVQVVGHNCVADDVP